MKILIVMGSDSDFDSVKPAMDFLDKMSVQYKVRICSAHRSPQLAVDIASSAKDNGFGVIIGAAGKAAHLAGVIAAHTILPVIGIPIKTSDLGGMDSLLSTVQMPSGIPVATVAINGAQNAAILAVQILALKDEDLAKKLYDYKKEMQDIVEKKDMELNK